MATRSVPRGEQSKSPSSVYSSHSPASSESITIEPFPSTLHSRIVVSKLPERRYFPSGLKATEETIAECPE